MATCTLHRPFTSADWSQTLTEYKAAGHNEMRRLFSPAAWLSTSTSALIIDIGSYTGEDIKSFLQRAGPLARNVSIHTYEPVPSMSAKLIRSMKLYRQVVVHNYGLGASTYSACIMGTGDGVRLVRKNGMLRCSGRTEVVDVRHALSKYHRPIDLLQINCEGCEAAVLQRLLERPTPLVIRAIEVQWHRVNSEQTYCNTEAMLRARGYVMDYRYPYVWERWVRK